MQNVEKLKNIKFSRKFYVREKKNVEFNTENRPIKWTNTATNESIKMMYDYRGRRCGKLFYNSAGTWTSTAKFFYKDFTLIQESTANNTITKEFVWDPTETIATRPLSMKCNVQNLNLLYTHDANKNITEVVYLATQNGIGAHYEYSPFGETIVSTRDTRISEIDIRTFNPFRFSSEYHDNELNLIYYNYRHYNSQTGRWISRDPIEEQGGTNLYNFVMNNPINNIDIWGLRCCSPEEIKKCIAGLVKAMNSGIDLLSQLLKYDPTADAKGGHKSGGGQITKSGGHGQRIFELKQGIKNGLIDFMKCSDCDNDLPSYPRHLDELANRQVPGLLDPNTFPITDTGIINIIPNPGPLIIIGIGGGGGCDGSIHPARMSCPIRN